MGLQKIERARRSALLESRTELSDDYIFENYYSRSQIGRADIVAAWHKASEALHVEPGKLRPEDNLESLVGLPRILLKSLPIFTDLDDLAYDCDQVERPAGNQDVLLTIDDVVMCLAGKSIAAR